MPVTISSLHYNRMGELVSSLSPGELEALKRILKDQRAQAAKMLKEIIITDCF